MHKSLVCSYICI